MKLNKKIVILLIPLFLIQSVMIETMEGSSKQESNTEFELQSLQAQDLVPEVITPGAGGEVEFKTNIIPDGDFSESDGVGGPNYFYYGGSGYSEVNPAYQDDVYSGSYAYLISTKGTEQFEESASSSRYLDSLPVKAYVNQGITLDFKFKIHNPDISQGGNIKIIFAFYNGSTYYLHYYLSTNLAISTNTTNTHHINLNGTIGSWMTFNQNITNDYIEAFGNPGASNTCYDLTFYTYSVINPLGAAEIILDEVRLYNSTNYQFLATTNWDFEDGNGNYWSYYFRGPTYCLITNEDSTEGTSSLNLTAEAFYESSYPSMYAEYSPVSQWTTPPRSYYAQNPDDLVIEFDWKYSDVSGGGNYQNAEFYIISQNETYTFYNNFVLGNGDDLFAYVNSTYGTYSSTYYRAESFGVRDTWNRFELDLYDLYQLEGIENAALSYVGYRTRAGNHANAIVNLLIDDLNVVTYPTADPSFEFSSGWSSSNPIPSWTNMNDDTKTNLTTDAHTGNYAANLTANADGTSLAYRNTDFEVDVNLYTDFWWKIDDMSSTGTSTAMIYLELNDAYNLYYILGSSSSANPSNSSSHCYFYVDNFNVTGVWNNLVRNVYDDATASFMGTDWNITRVTISCNSVTGLVSTIFDDMHFVKDTTGPDISSVTLSNNPTYYEDAIIDITVTDALADVSMVHLYYRNESTWRLRFATNIGGDVYRATVPTYTYGIGYEYYIAAFDSYNNINYDTNSSNYYTFTVGDDLAPTISITDPLNNTVVSGTITISVDADDVGSGIQFVDFLNDWAIIEKDSSAPYTVQWDTRTVANGIQQINCVAVDNAGNTNELTINVDCQNDLDEPGVTDLEQTPPSPMYTDSISIEVTVTDESIIEIVDLHYKIGEATWTTTPMILQGASIYSADIPAQVWNTEVLYYITATDEFDQIASLGTELDPFSFIVGDDVLPTLEVTHTSTDTITIKGENIFEIAAADIGSGIGVFEIYIDDILVSNTTTVPATYTWNTREYEDGEHIIAFVVKDNAGNIESEFFVFIVDNPPLATIISLTSLGALAIIAITVTILVLVRKRRIA